MALLFTLRTRRKHIHTTRVVPKDSQRQAEKKQAEAEQLEKRINEMEKAMVELEQRYASAPVEFVVSLNV